MSLDGLARLMPFAPPPARIPAPARLSVAEDSTLEAWILAGGTMTLEEFAEAGGVDVEAFARELRASIGKPGRPLILPASFAAVPRPAQQPPLVREDRLTYLLELPPELPPGED